MIPAKTAKRLGRVVFLVLAASTLLLLSEYVWTTGPLHLGSHEIGFALIVSLIVWALFEAQISQEAEATWDQRMERVTKNVFQAVLRKDLPKGLLDEANNLVLNSSMTRSDFKVTYTLMDSSFELSPGQSSDCVLVEALMEFSMRNVSTDTVCWKVAVALPNPVHPGLKDLVRVKTLTVRKGGEPVTLDLEKAEADFRADIRDNARTSVRYRAGEVSLRPGESCDLTSSYVMAKEAEDSELLQTLYPTDGLRITIFDQANDDRRMTFARSVHRESLQDVSGGEGNSKAKIFKIPGYLLPHQGVLIWWKRNPNCPGGTQNVPLQAGNAGVRPPEIEEDTR